MISRQWAAAMAVVSALAGQRMKRWPVVFIVALLAVPVAAQQPIPPINLWSSADKVGVSRSRLNYFGTDPRARVVLRHSTVYGPLNVYIHQPVYYSPTTIRRSFNRRNRWRWVW